MCWRMLAYAGVWAGVCWRMLTYADVCWRMLTYADVCWRGVTSVSRRRTLLSRVVLWGKLAASSSSASQKQSGGDWGGGLGGPRESKREQERARERESEREIYVRYIVLQSVCVRWSRFRPGLKRMHACMCVHYTHINWMIDMHDWLKRTAGSTKLARNTQRSSLEETREEHTTEQGALKSHRTQRGTLYLNITLEENREDRGGSSRKTQR
jgi:hypothetical protein